MVYHRRTRARMPDLTPLQWTLAFVAAASMGISKGGLAGLSLLHVTIFAFLFGARDSTGIVLPMLLVGDICAVTALHQHARWDYVRRMLPPACIGIVIGAWLMRYVNDSMFRPITGWIILGLAVLQLTRMQRPGWFGRRAAQPLVRVGHGTHRGRHDDAGECRRPDLRVVRARRGIAEVRDRRDERVVLLHHQFVQGAVQPRPRPHPRPDAAPQPRAVSGHHRGRVRRTLDHDAASPSACSMPFCSRSRRSRR